MESISQAAVSYFHPTEVYAKHSCSSSNRLTIVPKCSISLNLRLRCQHSKAQISGYDPSLSHKHSIHTSRSSVNDHPLSSSSDDLKKREPLPPVVVVGSANADIYVEIDRLPVEGETISARSGQTLAGGKGANQAACAAKLSTSSSAFFVGQLGEDAHGRLVMDALQEATCGRINLEFIGLNTSAPTGHAVVMLQPGGNNSIIIVGGANTSCWPDPLPDHVLGLVRRAGVLLLQREIPDIVNIQVAKAAKSYGVPVVLDVGGMDGPLPQELLQNVYMLSPNESELARITGLPTDSMEQVSQAAQKCHGMGVKQLLVKLGEKGSALFIQGKEAILQPMLPAANVVDTTGAGDTYTAAFAVALVEGKPYKDCMKFAAGAASLCVQVKGAIPSMPDRASVLRLL